MFFQQKGNKCVTLENKKGKVGLKNKTSNKVPTFLQQIKELFVTF